MLITVDHCIEISQCTIIEIKMLSEVKVKWIVDVADAGMR